MFDLGISKLIVIGVVALVVIGPEHLPKVARTAGLLLGRMQRYVANVKSEISQEIELEALKKMREEFEHTAYAAKKTVQEGFDFTHEKNNFEETEINHSSAAMTSAGLATIKRRRWRSYRGNLPLWYKQEKNKPTYLQSGAARVARHTPNRSNLRTFL